MKQYKRTKRVTVNLSEELYAKLYKYSIIHNRTLSDSIYYIVNNAVNKDPEVYENVEEFN